MYVFLQIEEAVGAERKWNSEQILNAQQKLEGIEVALNSRLAAVCYVSSVSLKNLYRAIPLMHRKWNCVHLTFQEY